MSGDGDVNFDKAEGRILSSPHAFKLAVFGANCSSGASMTSAEDRLKATWEESTQIARACDSAGIEALIPIARWRGFAGDTNFEGRSFDPITWAAGLSAITTTVQVFATVHVPTAHPVRLAKEVATIDHISGGRFGLNLVAGWNAPELSMFGLTQREHDNRYEFADEFVEILTRLATEEDEFDFAGQGYSLKNAISDPKPIQRPFPVVMSAGVSARGREFAARHADINIVVADDQDRAASLVRGVKEHAKERYGRDIMVLTQGHIVCADTEKEAKAKADYYFKDKLDRPGAEKLLSLLIPNTESHPTYDRVQRVACGWGALQLRGTPEQVVEAMTEIAATGVDGLLISWVDYLDGLEQFQSKILPLMIEAGLRSDESSDTGPLLAGPAVRQGSAADGEGI